MIIYDTFIKYTPLAISLALRINPEAQRMLSNAFLKRFYCCIPIFKFRSVNDLVPIAYAWLFFSFSLFPFFAVSVKD